MTLTEDALIVLIPLRAVDGTVRAYATIDAADAEIVGQYRWHLDAYGYAVRGAGGPTLHRFLLGLTKGDDYEGDHINRDRLDNRRSNLRAVPRNGRANQQNMSSSRGSASKFRGVSWNKGAGKWMAHVTVRRKQHFLGYFQVEEEAADAARQGRLRLLPYAVD